MSLLAPPHQAGGAMIVDPKMFYLDHAVSADLSGYAAGSLEHAENRPAFIEIDLKNAFNSHSRQAAFDTLAGVATCLLYTSPSPRDATLSRMPSSA